MSLANTSGCCNYSGGQPSLNPKYWIRLPVTAVLFHSRSGVRPSKAIEAVFQRNAGTKVECASIIIAAAYLALLRTMGPSAFDAAFKLLAIESGNPSLKHIVFTQVKLTTPSQLRVGDVVYFQNVHGMSDVWRGLNAAVVKAGNEPRFSGLGFENKSEKEILTIFRDQAVEERRLSASSTWATLSRYPLGLQLGSVLRPALNGVLDPTLLDLLKQTGGGRR
jgi:hypothetical protein